MDDSKPQSKLVAELGEDARRPRALLWTLSLGLFLPAGKYLDQLCLFDLTLEGLSLSSQR